MSANEPQILVTGATGHLGRLVIDALLKSAPASRIHAAARSEEAAKPLSALGVNVHIADYEKPATLDTAFEGIDRLLLISGNEFGKRLSQHRNVVDAAKRAGVGLIVYTSILHADTSSLQLAEEHRQTEAHIRQSGIPFVFLRNGWYNENYSQPIGGAVGQGALIGAAGSGRVSAAGRADYAEAAAAVLLAETPEAGKAYELAGDQAFSLEELAGEIAKASGKPIPYRNLSTADYAATLKQVGLPEQMADFLADCDRGIAAGELEDNAGELGRLIGRPTRPIAETVARTLAG